MILQLSQKKVQLLFATNARKFLLEIGSPIVIITDKNLANCYKDLLQNFTNIVIAPGESSKRQSVVDGIIEQLIIKDADKKVTIVGFGGGVVTDIAGYVASIYKRGVGLIQIPTSILGMVDAAVGGKNGVNTANHKNMVGTIYQPSYVLFDYSFLQTLPREEWINGFAEIIKHACIKDKGMFAQLQLHRIDDYRADMELTATMIEANVGIKADIVQADELETGDRMLLNFGHTIGHALEQNLKIPHGHAISIGMMAAARISEEINNFYSSEKDLLQNLLKQYELPVVATYNKEQLWEALLSDKKRDSNAMNFVLLNKIGEAKLEKISLPSLQDIIKQIL